MKSPKIFKSMGQRHTSHAISGENMEMGHKFKPNKCFPPTINLFDDFSHSLERGWAELLYEINELHQIVPLCEQTSLLGYSPEVL